MDKDKDKKLETEKTTALDISPKNQDVISYFEKDSSFVFAFKKTEKLVTAIYMVTNLFSDNEPVKWTLRKKATDILSLMAGYKNVVVSQKKYFVSDVKSRVLEASSLLEISSKTGLLSAMNFGILEKEFVNLIATLESDSNSAKEHTSNISLSRSFFYVPEAEEKEENVEVNFSNESISKSFSAPRISGANYASQTIKDTKDISDNGKYRRTNRQESIINLLRKKSNLSIKDIALVIKGCSEKTLQRELISLMEMGTVRREGERRWSKYSLNLLN